VKIGSTTQRFKRAIFKVQAEIMAISQDQLFTSQFESEQKDKPPRHFTHIKRYVKANTET
jgi:hypothetical protein